MQIAAAYADLTVGDPGQHATQCPPQAAANQGQGVALQERVGYADAG
jgi:hypothetical protein